MQRYINNKDIQDEITKTTAFKCISKNTVVPEILLPAKHDIFKSKCIYPSFDVFKMEFKSRLKEEHNLAHEKKN